MRAIAPYSIVAPMPKASRFCGANRHDVPQFNKANIVSSRQRQSRCALSPRQGVISTYLQTSRSRRVHIAGLLHQPCERRYTFLHCAGWFGMQVVLTWLQYSRSTPVGCRCAAPANEQSGNKAPRSLLWGISCALQAAGFRQPSSQGTENLPGKIKWIQVPWRYSL